MDAISVDPRDQRWQVDEPLYRVYFHEGTTAFEYEVFGARDVHEVVSWAEAEKGTRTYVLFARVDNPEGPGLIRLAGEEP